MARAYPAPDAFPGSRPDGWTLGGTSGDTPAFLLDREPDQYDYDVPPDPAVASTITPGGNQVSDGGIKPAPNPFPGYPNSQPNGSSGAGGAYGFGPGETNVSTTPQYQSMVGGVSTLNAPSAFPGGGQIPPGAPDSTGGGQVPRLDRHAEQSGLI